MQMCRFHCNAKKMRKEEKGTNGREIEDTPGGFTSAEHITDGRSHRDTENHVLSLIPLPHPYSL